MGGAQCMKEASHDPWFGFGLCMGRGPESRLGFVQESAPVTLNVYDFRKASTMNEFLRPRGLGVYHVGVEVFGWEWSYSDQPNPETGSGVFSSLPRECEGCQFREAVPRGVTYVHEASFWKIIADLEKRWRSSQYDVLKRNCCHFSEELCLALGVGSIPEWLKKLAKTGIELDRIVCCGLCTSTVGWGEVTVADVKTTQLACATIPELILAEGGLAAPAAGEDLYGSRASDGI